MRLIDALKVITEIERFKGYLDEDMMLRIKIAINRLPTIEAEPIKHGKWIYEPKDAIEMMFTKPKCSECGYESADGMYYCSYCGAKMDLDEVEE